jgi:DNA (cytosine-5)-methyltransferase 1
MQSIGIFSGVGAIELGFGRAGIETTLLCEVDAAAQAVLRRHYPRKRLVDDVRHLRQIPHVDILSAGFPCQDLSQAGETKGLNGSSSGLVSELFRLLRPRATRPNWVLLENVPFMLHLQRGRAMSVITESLERLGYAWAYRVIDSRSFGIPHRRRRVFLVASRSDDPRSVLFGQSCTFKEPRTADSHGFYWTEGNTGIGWAVDAVPALKAGSTISIPSPPAVWMPQTREIITPDIRDAERLQGLPMNWTRTITSRDARANRVRWRLVGNAVTVPIAEWIARRVQRPGQYEAHRDEELLTRDGWPIAAWGFEGKRFRVDVSEFPVAYKTRHLDAFLQFPGELLSYRAASGILSRLRSSTLNVRRMFLRDLERHVRRMERLSGNGE